jgi:polyisoprenoid-binding protein YceI
MTTTSPKDIAQIGGGTWTIDPNHSLIEFAARHFDIADVKGRFRAYSGTVEVDPQDLLKSRVELTIDATSVESGAVQGREDLIKGEEMLEVQKYPTITFRSTRIEPSGDGRFLITGDLTMHGTTSQVQLPMTFGGFAQTRMGSRAGFSGTLTLSRRDFGVAFAREFEPGRPVVSDEIKVELQIEVAPASQ